MKKNNFYIFLFCTIIFALFVLFFSQIHPLMPYNSDDWMFMSANRLAIPSPNYWNPSRVLPEILMPFFSGLAAYTIYPITGDYIGAMITMHSLVVSSFITLYAYFFIRLLRWRFSVSLESSLLYTVLFISLHFLIFRTADYDNRHLFYSNDLTCYYFYIIPNMLNAILVMSLLEHDWLEHNNFTPFKKGFVALAVYLAICSNLYCSDIFVIYIGCRLLKSVSWRCIDKKWCVDFIKEQWLSFAIILFWLFVNLLELMGARSTYLAETGEGGNVVTNIIDVVKTLMQWQINILFLGITLLTAIYGITYSYRRRILPKQVHILLMDIFITLIYIILVTSKVQTDYILRADIIFAAVFPLLLLVMISLIKASEEYKIITTATPLLILIVFSHINRSEPTFRDLKFDDNCTVEKLRRINNDIITQVIKADLTNTSDSVYVTVPFVKDDGLNWPYLILYNNGYNSISRTLYKHGVTQHLKPGKFVTGEPFSIY